MIFEHLDELSLIRAQGVSSTFNTIINGTKKIRQRLGLHPQGEDIVDTNIMSERVKVRWNPLLDWLITGFFIDNGAQANGPVSDDNEPKFFHFLPHALRGAILNSEITSSLYRMSITTPPIKRIHAHTPKPGILGLSAWVNVDRSCDHLTNDNGVTIGDFLERWAKLGERMKRQPLLMYIPSDFNDDGVRCTVRSLMWERTMAYEYRSELLRIRKIMTDSRKMEWQRPNMELGFNQAGTAAWYYCKAKRSNKNWWYCTMIEQREIMEEVMRSQKQISQRKLKAENVVEWPALAWDRDADDTAPYSVDYACGLIFNRQP